MSGEIKVGDLVMVVRGVSCCGTIGPFKYGVPMQVKRIFRSTATVCPDCGFHHETGLLKAHIGENGAAIYMLKKIDPPSKGDTLPTRKDLEIEA